MILPESVLVKKQVKNYEKIFKENNINHRIVCKVRYDDQCGNGHNSFSITGNIYSDESSSNEIYFVTGGCIHEEIAKHFPELKHLIKWHLTSSDGPMYYVDKTTYHARDVEPNLEAARSCAVWPDATLEQLQSEEALIERLPDLMHEFKKDIEALGFIY